MCAAFRFIMLLAFLVGSLSRIPARDGKKIRKKQNKVKFQFFLLQYDFASSSTSTSTENAEQWLIGNFLSMCFSSSSSFFCYRFLTPWGNRPHPPILRGSNVAIPNIQSRLFFFIPKINFSCCSHFYNPSAPFFIHRL